MEYKHILLDVLVSNKRPSNSYSVVQNDCYLLVQMYARLQTV